MNATQPTPTSLPETPVAVLDSFAHVLSGPRRDFGPGTVLDRFEACARQWPDAEAIVCNEARLSYSAVDRRANAIAWSLKEQGVTRDSVVAIWMPRSADSIVAMLGVMKAGAGYLPIDEDQPTARIEALIRRSGACMVLRKATREERAAPPARELTARSLAYVLYTSGSTGRPKGVAVEHGQLWNYFNAIVEFLDLPPRSRFATVSTLAADLGHTVIFPALCTGGTLHVVAREHAQNGTRLAEVMTRERIDVLKIVPSHLDALIESTDEPQRLLPAHQMVLGGEPLSWRLVDRIRNLAPACRIANHYGPTETTVGVCALQLGEYLRMDDGAPPVGRPLANVTLYLHADATLGPDLGELCVGGDQVARGYLDADDDSAERFIPNPLAAGRLYRTGDLARIRPDGTIELRGRADRQIKLHGYRIELDEVETAIAACPGVRDVVVVLRGEATATAAQLIAYYTQATGTAEAEAPTGGPALRDLVTQRLPLYMVPSAFIRMEALPLNSNGKVDRHALPAPDAREQRTGPVAEPQGEAESALAAIWAEVLGVTSVGRYDSFIALGGHSLLAVRAAARIHRRFGVEVPIAQFLDQSELCVMAVALASLPRAQLLPIERVPRDGDLAPSHAQSRLWFLAQLEPASTAYHIIKVLRVRGAIDVAALQQALDRITARHESLRTRLVSRQGVPAQMIDPQGDAPTIELYDGRDEPDGWLRQRVHEVAKQPFDFESGALLRVQLLQTGASEHVLVLVMHHVVSDGWSMDVLAHELATLYGAFHRGQPDPLPALEVQYADFAAWQRRWLQGDEVKVQAQYWLHALSGAPPALVLPTDRPRPARQDHAGASVSITLDTRISMSLRALAQRHGATIFVTLLAVWGAVLARLSGQTDFIVGAPVANRRRTEFEPLIGFFVNSLALRLDAADNPTIGQWLARVKSIVAAAQQHQDLPFEQVVELLRPERSLAHTPLFQVMFAWEGRALALPTLDGLAIDELDAPQSAAKFDLTLTLRERDACIVGNLTYATALFDRATIERHAAYFERMAEVFVGDGAQPLDAVDIVSASERQGLLKTAAQTKTTPAEVCVHRLFEAHAARRPQAEAVVQGEVRLSYRELNARANRLARHLLSMGVVRDDRVGVLLDRSPELVVAQLAALKAGTAFVPLDPALPAQRLLFMLDDCAPRVIISRSALWRRLQERAAHADVLSARLLELDSSEPPWADESVADLDDATLSQNPSQLAYVIYTSGSTGRPKGVQLEHRQLSNLIEWHRQRFAVGPGSTSSCLAGIGFDASVWEIWATLATGAKLSMPTHAQSDDPLSLLQWWRAEPLDVSFLPTPLAQLAFAEAIVNPTLKTLLVGGDRLSRSPPAQFTCEVVNNYGPTEAGVVATSGPVDATQSVLHIGRPIASNRIYILNPALRLQPTGTTGEIYIGGAGVARGYLNDPDLTARQFVPDPFAEASGARMYRSGDLARFMPDGNIEFLGRRDNQLKIRGFRIELGEIEGRLMELAPVREAVVVARTDETTESHLVAYLTLHAGGSSSEAGKLDIDALRQHLADVLPAYMVPAAFVVLTSLPLTPNGKVNRQALPLPDPRTLARAGYEAPRGQVEAALAQIWSQVLNRDRIGRGDNFFDIGGHSLLATQVMSRIRREFGVEQSVRTLFEQPTLERLAARLRVVLNDGIDRRLPLGEPSRIEQRGGHLQTSFSQRRMWLIQQLNPGNTAYNIALSLQIDGPLEVSALKLGLEIVCRRHEAFRTRFVAVDGEPMQVIDTDLEFDIEDVDLAQAVPEARPQLARDRFAHIVSMPFDLGRGRLYRLALAQIGAESHALLWVMHHAISDRWSFGILLRELRTVYTGLRAGKQVRLPALELDHADHAAWQREQARLRTSRAQLDYWCERLAGVRPIALPTDLPRLAPLEGRGGLIQVQLAAGFAPRIEHLARRQGATPFMLLLACYQILLARISGQMDVAVATPIANRLSVHSETLVGTLVNTLVMRCDLSGDPNFIAVLAQVQETALQAYTNQDASFEQLVEELVTSRDALRAPLAQVMFNLANTPFSLADFPDLDIRPFDYERRAAQFELSIGVDLGAIGTIHLSYASELFTAATARRLLGSYLCLVEGVLADPSRRISAYNIVDDMQQRELVAFNRGHDVVGGPAHLAKLLDGTAASIGERDAVVSAGSAFTYADLHARSNRLARELRARGVRRGALVGLCVERSAAMIVAQLAILKSGAAYVPLDPAYPAERLALMAADAQLALLVTQSKQAQTLRWPREKSLWLDDDAALIAAQDDGPLAPDESLDAGPTDPAYVIYTSGSTGRPKGVMVPHGAVLNFLASMAREPGLGPDDRLLAVTTLSFDIAVLELLLPLSVGATVVLASTDEALDGRALRALIERHRINVMQATPSTWRMLIDSGWTGAPGFKALIGGEALPPDLAAQLLERVGELWNMYGPTETTVWSTCWRVAQPENGICIGRPIANTQVHVLDAAGQLCPIGVPGELHIGGAGVALGYLHRPDLTEERFIPDRFSTTPNARLYKTGDLGRWRYDGQLEHMGRLDHQVKIRGHRVELGEIEAALASHPGVARAVAIVREDRPGDARLTAYIVPRGAMPDAGALRDHLRATLPQYMIPQHLVALEAIPLLPNGKLDRAQLPRPNEIPAEPRSGTGLTTDEERSMAEVWERLLEIGGVGRDDNFFDLGGHSLLAVRAASEMEQVTGLHISPRRLIFETLAQLAATPRNEGGDGAGTASQPEAPAARSRSGRFIGGLRRLFGDRK